MKKTTSPLDDLIRAVADDLFSVFDSAGDHVGDRLAIMKRDAAGNERSLGGRNRASVESILRQHLTPLLGVATPVSTFSAIDQAIELGQRWSREYRAAGKPELAKYYLKQVLALQVKKLRPKNKAK